MKKTRERITDVVAPAGLIRKQVEHVHFVPVGVEDAGNENSTACGSLPLREPSSNWSRVDCPDCLRAALAESETRERELEESLQLEVDRREEFRRLWHERGVREEVLVEALKAADWLIECLDRIAFAEHRVVRGLGEAREFYRITHEKVAALAAS